jgi:hypothetical protein
MAKGLLMVVRAAAQRALTENEAQKVCTNAAITGGIILTGGMALLVTKVAMTALTCSAQMYSSGIGFGVGIAEIYVSQLVVRKVEGVDRNAVTAGIAIGHVVALGLLCLSYYPTASFSIGAMGGALMTATRVRDRIMLKK